MATAKTAAGKADSKPKAKAAPAAKTVASAPIADPPAAAPAVQPDPAASSAPAADPVAQDKPAETFVDTAPAAPAPGRQVDAVHRLEWAQDLPELAKRIPADQVSKGIQSFKDTDRRTMNVVLSGDRLFKQEV